MIQTAIVSLLFKWPAGNSQPLTNLFICKTKTGMSSMFLLFVFVKFKLKFSKVLLLTSLSQSIIW